MIYSPYFLKPNKMSVKSKNAFGSKTILGIVLLLLPMVKQLTGFELSASEVTNLFTNIDLFVELGSTILGTILGIYGRAKADGKLHLFKK